tara:strand:+ start:323 stop:544 length:222 start_codon:yes stop_codon:yes gene_type:complete
MNPKLLVVALMGANGARGKIDDLVIVIAQQIVIVVALNIVAVEPEATRRLKTKERIGVNVVSIEDYACKKFLR